MTKTALVAIGGNSLIDPSGNPNISAQWDTVRDTCRNLADMIEAGWNLVITHGNGPQAGFNLRRSEIASNEIYPLPLDIIVAHTQGSIGYMLQQALENELSSRGISRPILSIITQVLVDANDPGFANPTKPVGGFMSEEEARAFEKEGWTVVEDSGRGWRRVVASPKPLQIIERRAIQRLVETDCIAIAVGGGGIPVVQNMSGELRELKGVYAVIDKDRASSLLAKIMKVDLFLISTGVPQVCLNFNKPDQVDLDKMTLAEADGYIKEGHFAKGSMLPKIEAAAAFVRATGGEALITDPSSLGAALRGEAGTRIVAK